MLVKQADLFSADNPAPEINVQGLNYIADYISTGDEQALLPAIDGHDWLSDLKRRVQHYGYKYDYNARAVDAKTYLGPMPAWVSELCWKLTADKIFPVIPDQVIVNEYLPGQGISAHIDCVPCFGEAVASLSLGSSCIMEFSHPGSGDKKELLLEERSLVVLSGPARYEWRHAIPARKSDVSNGVKTVRKRRISLTFRKVIL
jgi:alkylated DNA repair dioxygenase AlkB